MEFPKASEDLLPDLYEELDESVETVETVLRARFPVVNEGEANAVAFGRASEADFLEAMHDAPKVMVPFFMKISGLPSREFERVYGVKNIDAMKSWSQKDLRES